jgi:hypothetical protein
VDPLGLCPKSTESSFTQRQSQILKDDVGYNVSPESFYRDYPAIGRNGTFVTDAQAFKTVGPINGSQQYSVGLFSNASKNQVSYYKAWQLERGLGLERRSLWEGFRLKEIKGISGMSPRSPLEGNQYFLGFGKGLPNGAPEMVIDSVATTWPWFDYESYVLRFKHTKFYYQIATIW